MHRGHAKHLVRLVSIRIAQDQPPATSTLHAAMGTLRIQLRTPMPTYLVVLSTAAQASILLHRAVLYHAQAVPLPSAQLARRAFLIQLAQWKTPNLTSAALPSRMQTLPARILVPVAGRTAVPMECLASPSPHALMR